MDHFGDAEGKGEGKKDESPPGRRGSGRYSHPRWGNITFQTTGLIGPKCDKIRDPTLSAHY
jgi:hypothetical protein